MSKEEFLKIQTSALKVNIHCDGCKQKVKKILQKIDGVYTIEIDSEQGKVTVSGSVDAAMLIKKLTKNGKYAEVWGASAKAQNNAQNNQNLLKNLPIAGAKAGGDKKGGIDLPKGGVQNQIQLMKGLQGLKMMPLSKEQNQKSGKFSKPEDEDLSDYDDEDDYDDDDDDDFDDDEDDYDESDEDDLEDVRTQMKPAIGNGHGGSFMPNLLMNGKLPIKGGGDHGGKGGENPKTGGPQVNGGGGKNGADGNNNNGGNQNQAGGKGGGGGQTNKNGNHGGGGAANGNNLTANDAKKVGGMNASANGMPYMMPMAQMGNLAAVPGMRPLTTAPGGGAGLSAGGHFTGARPEHLPGNPYHQQQLAAMMMPQHRPNTGKESLQPMMYAPPPPAVNYAPPYLPPYPYPPPPGELIDQYNIFNDENTSSCSLM